MNIPIPTLLSPLINLLLSHKLKPIIVGGFVRDSILGISSKDIDIEIYGIETVDKLKILLKQFGNVNEVGKSFGVLKLIYKGIHIDFSLPRIESKISSGHKGFKVEQLVTPSFTIASKRRDFTINAMGYDLEKRILLDPYNGQVDLNNKLLRCVNEDSFIEDPLRVLRAVQFVARYELTMEDKLLKLCQTMVMQNILYELPKERIFDEIKKLLLKSVRPSIGFNLMNQIGILNYFSELKAIIGVEQNPQYHPEGDVWTHTLMSLDKMALMRTDDDKLNLILMLAVLCHDLGKVSTTAIIDGKIISFGHEEAGVEPTQTLLNKLTNEQRLIDRILPLVKYHLRPTQLYTQGAKSSAIRRLAHKVNIDHLILIAKADFLGRDTKEAKDGRYPAGEWLKERAEKLNVLYEAPQQLLQGKDLIKHGLTPSKQFKIILQTAYNAQLEGIYNNTDEAQKWLKDYLIQMDLI